MDRKKHVGRDCVDEKREIIHCDICFAICMSWENYCTICGQERTSFAWHPVLLGSPEYMRREELRGTLQTGGMLLLHCDKCYSLTNMESDIFCGVCGVYLADSEWIYVAYGSPEYQRREKLQIGALNCSR